MKTKTFSIVTTVSLVFAIVAVVCSSIGFAMTSLYPGLIVIFLIALIPIASKFYAKKISTSPTGNQKNYFTTLTVINLLSILVLLWMTFVIVHDRVLQDC